ncbi:MAG: ABC-type transport auxiliary lipoprotein family protein [Pseudomonadota bacterium]
MKAWRLAAVLSCAVLAGCGGLLRSDTPAPLAYQLRAGGGSALSPTVAIDLAVLRPLARPGLDSDAIAVWLPDRRFDAYAASRWSAPLPDLVQSLLLDDFRAREAFERVLTDRGQFRGRYWLQTEIRDFQAEYAREGAAPRVRVTLRGEIGRVAERRALGSIVGRGEVQAASNRLRDVTAAFEQAYAQAAVTLTAGVHAAVLAAERTSAPAPTPESTKAP